MSRSSRELNNTRNQNKKPKTTKPRSRSECGQTFCEFDCSWVSSISLHRLLYWTYRLYMMTENTFTCWLFCIVHTRINIIIIIRSTAYFICAFNEKVNVSEKNIKFLRNQLPLLLSKFGNSLRSKPCPMDKTEILLNLAYFHQLLIRQSTLPTA